mmetsp:Transcript_2858/g.5348  ORF Transcript_2858/g.5348 Transcript_2858/m.5348 type:complete len:475 (+) Transcript_2858:1979-3403(+)
MGLWHCTRESCRSTPPWTGRPSKANKAHGVGGSGYGELRIIDTDSTSSSRRCSWNCKTFVRSSWIFCIFFSRSASRFLTYVSMLEPGWSTSLISFISSFMSSIMSSMWCRCATITCSSSSKMVLISCSCCCSKSSSVMFCSSEFTGGDTALAGLPSPCCGCGGCSGCGGGCIGPRPSSIHCGATAAGGGWARTGGRGGDRMPPPELMLEAMDVGDTGSWRRNPVWVWGWLALGPTKGTWPDVGAGAKLGLAAGIRWGRGAGGPWGRPGASPSHSLSESDPLPSLPSLPSLSSLTRSAYLRVFRECSQLADEGEMLAIMTVRQLPMNESRSTSVSLEPRKGTCLWPWSRERMHSFSASRLLLISAPSMRVCFSEFMVSAPRSLPARSMNVNLPYNLSVRIVFTAIWRMAWDREDSLFAPVSPEARWVFPKSIRLHSESTSPMACSVRPTIFTFDLASSRAHSLLRPFSRSKSFPP